MRKKRERAACSTAEPADCCNTGEVARPKLAVTCRCHWCGRWFSGVLLVLGLFTSRFLLRSLPSRRLVGAWEIGHVLNTRRGYGIPEYLLGGLSGAIVVVAFLFGFTGLGIAPWR